MNKSLIRKKLKEIEPRYLDWNEDEIDRQIENIYNCGYKWNEEYSNFYNERIDMFLKIQGLNTFKPEDISEFYERVWSKEKPRTETDRSNSKKGCFIFIMVSLAVYFLVEYKILNLHEWYISLPIGIFSFLFIIYISKYFK